MFVNHKLNYYWTGNLSCITFGLSPASGVKATFITYLMASPVMVPWARGMIWLMPLTMVSSRAWAFRENSVRTWRQKRRPLGWLETTTVLKKEREARGRRRHALTVPGWSTEPLPLWWRWVRCPGWRGCRSWTSSWSRTHAAWRCGSCRWGRPDPPDQTCISGQLGQGMKRFSWEIWASDRMMFSYLNAFFSVKCPFSLWWDDTCFGWGFCIFYHLNSLLHDFSCEKAPVFVFNFFGITANALRCCNIISV